MLQLEQCPRETNANTIFPQKPRRRNLGIKCPFLGTNASCGCSPIFLHRVTRFCVHIYYLRGFYCGRGTPTMVIICWIRDGVGIWLVLLHLLFSSDWARYNIHSCACDLNVKKKGGGGVKKQLGTESHSTYLCIYECAVKDDCVHCISGTHVYNQITGANTCVIK